MFDEGFEALAGDELRVSNLADVTLMALDRRTTRMPVRHTRWLLIAATMVAASVSAAATWAVMGAKHPFASRDRARVLLAMGFPAAIRSAAVTPVIEPAVEIAALPDEPSAPVIPVLSATRSARIHSTHSADHLSGEPDASASDLFARANAQRRAGDARSARALYSHLQRTYPNTMEAIVSHVALGRLLLDRSQDPRGALSQFDQYLSQHTDGELVAEALFGRARALLLLHRTSLERSAWRTLIERYPSSVYAARAHQRLEALDRLPAE